MDIQNNVAGLSSTGEMARAMSRKVCHPMWEGQPHNFCKATLSTGWLNHQNIFPCGSGGWKSKMKWLCAVPSEASLQGSYVAVSSLGPHMVSVLVTFLVRKYLIQKEGFIGDYYFRGVCLSWQELRQTLSQQH